MRFNFGGEYAFQKIGKARIGYNNLTGLQFGIGIDVLVHPGFPPLVNDANVHFSCMKIDTTIEFVLLIVKSHGLPPFSLSVLMMWDQ